MRKEEEEIEIIDHFSHNPQASTYLGSNSFTAITVECVFVVESKDMDAARNASIQDYYMKNVQDCRERLDSQCTLNTFSFKNTSNTCCVAQSARGIYGVLATDVRA